MWSGLMDWLKSNEELLIEYFIIKLLVIYIGKECVLLCFFVEIILLRFLLYVLVIYYFS